MSEIKILNGLPLGAMPEKTKIQIHEIDEDSAKILVFGKKIVSFIGHEATAKLLSQKLGVEIPFNRANASFEKGECFLVCSLNMPRLAEGQILTEEQIKNVPIRYFFVCILNV